MAREYPRIGSWGGKPQWTKDPKTAPCCTVPGCTARATRQPWIEVNWFRGDDERSGPVCKEHSEASAAQLLEWAEAWRDENKRKNDEAQARAAARKAATAGVQAVDDRAVFEREFPDAWAYWNDVDDYLDPYKLPWRAFKAGRNAGVALPRDDQGENHG